MHIKIRSRGKQWTLRLQKMSRDFKHCLHILNRLREISRDLNGLQMTSQDFMKLQESSWDFKRIQET
jgi:hypothetical protein